MVLVYVAMLLVLPALVFYGVARSMLPAASAPRAIPLAVGAALPLVALWLAVIAGFDSSGAYDLMPHVVAATVAAVCLFVVLVRTPASLAAKVGTGVAVALMWSVAWCAAAFGAVLAFGGIC